jgi:hypothetical protein
MVPLHMDNTCDSREGKSGNSEVLLLPSKLVYCIILAAPSSFL